ncbi:MAG TPA: phenylalanine--tRNA ligase subunit beta, partial [Phycisphaerae bacterium]|nr:phenylalanine--tRNA ligase subunit beta [Phycisphaerae bacterium]
PLAAYDVTPASELSNTLPALPIEIDDPARCMRFSALAFEGLRSQPSPLWMQARLALCGMRPIDLIVDLTNYVMLELGQPMHAFDGAKIANIQVANAKPGTKFRTLDGVERSLPPETLMIQSDRKNVGIAGIMGGAETEVGPATTTVLLESANFDAATIRRAATEMGHRTEASARFEKSLDPANTILGLGRFHKLALRELPSLKLAGTLSDGYPRPKQPAPIRLDCEFAARVIGNIEGARLVTSERMIDIFSRLEFKCEMAGSGASRSATLEVTPPSFRATKDISIEADLIEEIARFVGYNNIIPSMPRMTARHLEPAKPLALEERTLSNFCLGADFVEVQNYIWHDDDWLKRIGFDPGECITLRNPAANNCSRLRKTLAPGLIAMAEQNRHHFDSFQLIEIGSVFEPGHDRVEASQHRRLGLLIGRQGKGSDKLVWDGLKLALAGWATHAFEAAVRFESAKETAPWEHGDRTAAVLLSEASIGRATLLPPELLTKLDERLRSWAFALAEVDLRPCVAMLEHFEKLPTVPRFPQPDLDFSVLIDASRRFGDAAKGLSSFRHPLLKRLTFIDSYEGGSIPDGRRSLLFRARIGSDERTLTDEEIHTFNVHFREFLTINGMELRS